jgi:predicted RecB family nuclease
MTIVQKTITGSVIYSHFRYLCPYHTWLLFNVGLPEVIPAPSDRLLMESGIKHEEEALRYFQREYGDGCAVISSEDGLSDEEDIRARFERTLAAMSEGKPIIYHGILVPEDRLIHIPGRGPMILRGETDFLFRMDGKGISRFGDYHYEVGDAKSSRSSKFCQQMQVAFYSWLLESIQGVRPQCGRVLTRPLGIEQGPSPFREELFLIDDHIWTLMTFLEEEFREVLQKKEGDFFFHPKGGCGTCPFHDHCLERATASNDLSLLPDIHKIQKRHLNKVGIRDIEALANAEDDVLQEAARATGVTFEGLAKIRRQATATVTSEATSRGAFDSPRDACLAMTAGELDLPGEKEGIKAIDFTDLSLVHVHFDMESNPYTGTEYLFGMMVDIPGRRGSPEFFTAHSYSDDDEFHALQSFIGRMDKIRNEVGDQGFAIFHYAHYEPTHLLKLAEKHRERSTDLIDRVDYLNRRMVDLYKLIRKTYYLPVSSYSIKDVAPCIRSLMEKRGLSGGHEWKKIQSLAQLEEELAGSGWSGSRIEESIHEVREAMAHFGLTDEAAIFDASADMSVVWFNLYVERKSPVWMKLIEIYNADDLKATRSLVDWFLFMQARD